MKKAILSFSGGLDSTVCSAWAKQNYDEVIGVTFDYDQRNKDELKSAEYIANKLGITHIVLDASYISKLSPSYLTDMSAVIEKDENKSNTFVPGRNIFFSTMVGVVAYLHNANTIIMGVNADDYHYYPDCRKEFIESMHNSLRLGLDMDLQLVTPLVEKTKVEIFQMADSLGILDLVVEHTNSCYNGVVGMGCGKCPACELRRGAYQKFLELKELKRG